MDLAKTIAAQKTDNLAIVQATVGRKDGKYYVAVGSNHLSCTWIDTITVSPGDKVVCAVQSPISGTGTAIVLGRLTETPRSLYATTVTSSSSSATVKVKDVTGAQFDALWLGDTPPPAGTIVALLWQGATPIILGKRRVATSETDDDVNALKPIEPPPPVYRERYVRAYDSGTWSYRYQLWSNHNPGRIYAGTWAGATSAGLFFYGGAASNLTGVSTLQIYIGSRHRAGSYNSTVQVIFRLSSTRSKSDGAPSMGDSQTWSCPPGWNGGWVNLPASWATDLSKGASIAVTSPGYAVFQGVGENAVSGQIYAK